jgi:hypothetical protein
LSEALKKVPRPGAAHVAVEGDTNVAGTATVTLELAVPVVVEVITKEQTAALLFTK